MSKILSDQPTICACLCGCRRMLTEGNVMEFKVETNISVLICIECYTGAHAADREDNLRKIKT